jgi:hypothetical protein
MGALTWYRQQKIMQRQTGGHIPTCEDLSGLNERLSDYALSHLHAQLNPLLWSGRVRILLPVAANMALPIAGRIGGSVGSPSPVGA